jgi:predicted ATP-grasp superfamily ATP-dependent carboligase
MRVLVYEHLCAGGLADQASSAALFAEGWAMLAAALSDLSGCPGVRPVTLVRPGLLQLVQAVAPDAEAHPATAEAERQFRELARSAAFALVIAPEFDDLLARRCEWALQEGSRLLGPSPQAIRLTADKLALAERLLQAGVPTPPTRVCPPEAPPFPFPVVCKPRRGAGSQHTFRIGSRASYLAILREAEALSGWGSELIVQPWVGGLPASITFLVGPGAAVALPACEQQLSDDGTCRYLGGRAPLPAALHKRAERLARRAVAAVPGLEGHFGLDLVLGEPGDGSADFVIEINPRLTTSYAGLRRLAKGNLMEALLAVARGQPLKALSWHDGEVSFLAGE